MLRIHALILLALIAINSTIVGRNQIFLPIYAHHTVGEAPIIEHFDDKIMRNVIDYGLISSDGAYEIVGDLTWQN